LATKSAGSSSVPISNKKVKLDIHKSPTAISSN
jgi:hypothetical protein